MSSYSREPSGIPGLDEILQGGFPRGRVILILGGPGTGKTLLCSQFLYNGIIKYEKNGIFVSLDETKVHFYREMHLFGMNFGKLESKKKFIFLDASPIRHVPEKVKIGDLKVGRADFSVAGLIERIKISAEMVNAQRIAVDPISSLFLQYTNSFERRTAIVDLVEALTQIGATVLMTSELLNGSTERRVRFEEYISHGVILLQKLSIRGSSVRAIQVEKMRESDFDLNLRPYRISSSGIEVFPQEKIIW